MFIPRCVLAGAPTSATSGTLRRSSSNLSQGQKPAPPVRRNSSIQSISAASSPTDTSNPDAAAGDARRTQTNNSSSRKASASSCAKSSSVNTAGMGSNDSFELPPPPPPEELARDLANATAASCQGRANQAASSGCEASSTAKSHVQSVSQITHIYERAGYKAVHSLNQVDSMNGDVSAHQATVTSSLQRQGSIADKHGHIINTLNSKLARPSCVQPAPQQQQQAATTVTKPPQTLQSHSASSRSSRHGPPPAVAEKPRMTSQSQHRDADSDLTPTADSPGGGGGTLLAQIKNGVQLRKSQCNDRSAPKVL